ncbi:PREDICTED: kinesin-related protein 4-like [Nicotiana attenuata]|uniref:kinesin-related protein 4-like n=1 Tax=Nicotiana attenuata TaxID=49451 RepID=UPI000905ADC3|nr:PREDICTED: kinesin-related protein 4-like [Nicotiana attenuata]
MKKKQDNERREPKREQNLVLKTNNNDSSGKDADMAYLTKRFQKEAFQKGGAPASQKVMTYVITAQYQYKNNTDKAAKRNLVPDKRFKRKNVADNVVKQTLAAWGDSSSKSEEYDDQGDSSMMAVESEAVKYDSIFVLMAQSDADEDDDDDDDEVNFLDVQRNLKSYSQKKLMSLVNVLIDSYHRLINDKDALIIELGEAEQSRDDLVVVLVDLKKTIESLEKEKDAFTEKIANIEHERDDLVVVVVDLKETIECVKKEKEVLIEKVANIEHERDDLLVVVVDLKEIIEELKRESRPRNTQKGKEVASEAHLKLENELRSVKSSLCAKLEKNRQL